MAAPQASKMVMTIIGMTIVLAGPNSDNVFAIAVERERRMDNIAGRENRFNSRQDTTFIGTYLHTSLLKPPLSEYPKVAIWPLGGEVGQITTQWLCCS